MSRCPHTLLSSLVAAAGLVAAVNVLAVPVVPKKLDGAALAAAQSATAKLSRCSDGWGVIATQSFRLAAPGDVRDGAIFASAVCPSTNKFAFLTRLASGQVFGWESHAVNQWPMPEEVAGVSFPDVNGDGHADVVVAASAITGAGPEGTKPFLAFDALVSDAKTGSTGQLRRLDPAVQQALDSAKNLAGATALLRKRLQSK